MTIFLSGDGPTRISNLIGSPWASLLFFALSAIGIAVSLMGVKEYMDIRDLHSQIEPMCDVREANRMLAVNAFALIFSTALFFFFLTRIWFSRGRIVAKVLKPVPSEDFRDDDVNALLDDPKYREVVFELDKIRASRQNPFSRTLKTSKICRESLDKISDLIKRREAGDVSASRELSETLASSVILPQEVTQTKPSPTPDVTVFDDTLAGSDGQPIGTGSAPMDAPDGSTIASTDLATVKFYLQRLAKSHFDLTEKFKKTKALADMHTEKFKILQSTVERLESQPDVNQEELKLAKILRTIEGKQALKYVKESVDLEKSAEQTKFATLTTLRHVIALEDGGVPLKPPPDLRPPVPRLDTRRVPEPTETVETPRTERRSPFDSLEAERLQRLTDIEREQVAELTDIQELRLRQLRELENARRIREVQADFETKRAELEAAIARDFESIRQDEARARLDRLRLEKERLETQKARTREAEIIAESFERSELERERDAEMGRLEREMSDDFVNAKADEETRLYAQRIMLENERILELEREKARTREAEIIAESFERSELERERDAEFERLERDRLDDLETARMGEYTRLHNEKIRLANDIRDAKIRSGSEWLKFQRNLEDATKAFPAAKRESTSTNPSDPIQTVMDPRMRRLSYSGAPATQQRSGPINARTRRPSYSGAPAILQRPGPINVRTLVQFAQAAAR